MAHPNSAPIAVHPQQSYHIGTRADSAIITDDSAGPSVLPRPVSTIAVTSFNPKNMIKNYLKLLQIEFDTRALENYSHRKEIEYTRMKSAEIRQATYSARHVLEELERTIRSLSTDRNTIGRRLDG